MSWATNTTTDNPLTVCDPCVSTMPGTYTLVLGTLCALGVPITGKTVWILVSSPFTEKTDLLSFNLLINDFLLCLSTALTMVGMFVQLQLPHFIWSFVLCLLTCGRPLFQCLICVERYLAVEHPTFFLRYRPPRYRLTLLAVVWPVLLLTSGGAVITCVTHQNHNKPYLSFQYAVLLIIITVNTFCCVCVLRALIRPPPGDARLRDLKDRKKDKKSQGYQIKKKAFTVVFMTQIYLIVCYLPPLIIIGFQHLVNEKQFCAVYSFHLWFVLLSLCSNCLFYLYNKGELKLCKCL